MADARIDLRAIVRGMGVEAYRAIDRAGTEDALEAARNDGGPSLVEVVTDPNEPQAGEWMRRE